MQLGFFPSVGSYSICKTTQEHASDTGSVTLLSSSVTAWFGTGRGVRDGWGHCRVLIDSVSILRPTLRRVPTLSSPEFLPESVWVKGRERPLPSIVWREPEQKESHLGILL